MSNTTPPSKSRVKSSAPEVFITSRCVLIYLSQFWVYFLVSFDYMFIMFVSFANSIIVGLTSNYTLLDVTVSLKTRSEKKGYNKHLILIRMHQILYVLVLTVT